MPPNRKTNLTFDDGLASLHDVLRTTTIKDVQPSTLTTALSSSSSKEVASYWDWPADTPDKSSLFSANHIVANLVRASEDDVTSRSSNDDANNKAENDDYWTGC